MPNWVWDEISCEIAEVTEELMADWLENGEAWELEGITPEGIEVSYDDRGHLGLIVEAETAEAAHDLFMTQKPYREFQV